jgi:hypothetical protein
MADAFSGVTAESLRAAREASLNCFRVLDESLDRIFRGHCETLSNTMPVDEFVELAKQEHRLLNQTVQTWQQALDGDVEHLLLKANADTAVMVRPFEETLPSSNCSWDMTSVFLRDEVYHLGHQAAGLHLRAAICSMNMPRLENRKGEFIEGFWDGIEKRRRLNKKELIQRIKDEGARAEKLLDESNGPDVRESAKDTHAADLLERFPENDIRTLIVLLETLSQPWWWRVNQEQWNEFERYRDIGNEEAGWAYRYDREGESAKAEVHRRYSQEFHQTSENYHAIRIHAFHNTVTRAETILRRELKKLLGEFPPIDLKVERTTPAAEMAKKFKRLLGLVLAEVETFETDNRHEQEAVVATADGNGVIDLHKEVLAEVEKREPSTATTGAKAVVKQEAKRVKAALQELKSTTPKLTTGDGIWVSNKLAAKLEGVKTRTLADYRCNGISNGLLGRDHQGRVWRKPGTKNSHPLYLRSTLKAT